VPRALNSITVNAPTGSVSANVNDTFDFTGTPGFSGSGGVNRYDFKWEVDGGGGYVTIASSGTGLTTAGTNPVTNSNSTSSHTISVTCASAGSYTIRMVGAPTTGGSYTVTSATRSITVSAQAITGTGALNAQASTASGAGVSSSTGTGGLTAQAVTIAGSGTSASTGTGALASQASAVNGEGTVEDADTGITGTGTLSAASATLAGEGISLSTGTGAVSAAAASLSGEGTVSTAGTGSLIVAAATMEGAGTVTGQVQAATRWNRPQKIFRMEKSLTGQGVNHLGR
jgi:hypothetical protein